LKNINKNKVKYSMNYYSIIKLIIFCNLINFTSMENQKKPMHTQQETQKNINDPNRMSGNGGAFTPVGRDNPLKDYSDPYKRRLTYDFNGKSREILSKTYQGNNASIDETGKSNLLNGPNSFSMDNGNNPTLYPQIPGNNYVPSIGQYNNNNFGNNNNGAFIQNNCFIMQQPYTNPLYTRHGQLNPFMMNNNIQLSQSTMGLNYSPIINSNFNPYQNTIGFNMVNQNFSYQNPLLMTNNSMYNPNQAAITINNQYNNGTAQFNYGSSQQPISYKTNHIAPEILQKTQAIINAHNQQGSDAIIKNEKTLEMENNRDLQPLNTTQKVHQELLQSIIDKEKESLESDPQPITAEDMDLIIKEHQIGGLKSFVNPKQLKLEVQKALVNKQDPNNGPLIAKPVIQNIQHKRFHINEDDLIGFPSLLDSLKDFKEKKSAISSINPDILNQWEDNAMADIFMDSLSLDMENKEKLNDQKNSFISLISNINKEDFLNEFSETLTNLDFIFNHFNYDLDFANNFGPNYYSYGENNNNYDPIDNQRKFENFYKENPKKAIKMKIFLFLNILEALYFCDDNNIQFFNKKVSISLDTFKPLLTLLEKEIKKYKIIDDGNNDFLKKTTKKNLPRQLNFNLINWQNSIAIKNPFFGDFNDPFQQKNFYFHFGPKLKKYYKSHFPNPLTFKDYINIINITQKSLIEEYSPDFLPKLTKKLSFWSTSKKKFNMASKNYNVEFIIPEMLDRKYQSDYLFQTYSKFADEMGCLLENLKNIDPKEILIKKVVDPLDIYNKYKKITIMKLLCWKLLNSLNLKNLIQPSYIENKEYSQFSIYFFANYQKKNNLWGKRNIYHKNFDDANSFNFFSLQCLLNYSKHNFKQSFCRADKKSFDKDFLLSPRKYQLSMLNYKNMVAQRSKLFYGFFQNEISLRSHEKVYKNDEYVNLYKHIPLKYKPILDFHTGDMVKFITAITKLLRLELWNNPSLQDIIVKEPTTKTVEKPLNIQIHNKPMASNSFAIILREDVNLTIIKTILRYFTVLTLSNEDLCNLLGFPTVNYEQFLGNRPL